MDKLKGYEITAMYNHLYYGIGLCKKLHRILESIDYNKELFQEKINTL